MIVTMLMKMRIKEGGSEEGGGFGEAEVKGVQANGLCF